MSQWQQDPYQRRPVDIDAYAPPRRGSGAWLMAALGVLLLGTVLGVLFLRPVLPGAASSPTAAPTTRAESAGPGTPFTMPGSTTSRGRWEVVSRSWVESGVVVRVKVSADSGRISYGFVAFSNTRDNVYEPETGAPDPEIGSGRLSAGQSIEGNVFLPLPRGAATLILTTEEGRQVSAIAIPA